MDFRPSNKGFIDLRNEGFVQDACLSKAREVASIASGASGRAFSCDVRPGRSRCHARASCEVPVHPRDEWYSGAFAEAKEAAAAAAEAAGGERATGKGSR